MVVLPSKNFQLLLLTVVLDVNECSQTDNLCDHGCHNTDGSFSCSCRDGYELSSNGRRCKGRHPKFNCQQIVEFFFKYKKKHIGYHGSSLFLSDINECKQENICPEDSTCTNKRGWYKCTCKTGYQNVSAVNGHICQGIKF